MKTILVVYSNRGNKLTSKEIAGMKRYSFNTEADVKEGDIINSPNYPSSPLTVVKVLETAYKHYNSINGELSNEFKSTAQWDIKTLIIREADAPDVVYGTIVEQKTDK